MKILSIEASTTGCSVALFENDKLLSAIESRIDRSSAEFLTTLIDQVLMVAKVEKLDLDAIAVAKGPGSYTGLRIAVSTAKGFAFALDKPLLSFGTLDAMCYQVNGYPEGILLCPMIDARRMEVFCAFYDGEEKKQKIAVEAVIVEEQSFEDILLNNKVLFFGEGSAKCEDVLKSTNALFLTDPIIPSAAFSGKICNEKYNNGEFEDLTLFEPYYLKEYMFKTKKP
ncbi:tRNA (adenosine(37)-N6)-threonylcarbamoyltransferase complex dimerization subunit type 1 TsaB [Lacihabitans sp. LS3-19]|uniref:tRNA (adenosine(37)-N6)-threonylcarbamoyltransferase complex dimerization subunit type 1 TsaB n=1 Tax=Lacihabitans sp. LS3-19 TaxID=2487335 RepID=UPI0020CD0E47|nr:tRNA (adenosine(37)-N6)-threonylcarbamoyltransferase complex dimerization subunit type 1 TsaB [Lacihabitans sp. LS3-19]MCP9770341.1 tRNA (adenosine(37)-N6)-threonylcarbamoyltransferase complex dimerization subunit type 1 TsaB [Lacihabitans sp. LS3-19]